MYEELIKRLRYENLSVLHMCNLINEAADTIEKLNSQVESLCKTIDLYHKLLDGHPDPRGEDGEPGIKCIDCQMDCQMIGLDMPACTAYVPPKEET